MYRISVVWNAGIFLLPHCQVLICWYFREYCSEAKRPR